MCRLGLLPNWGWYLGYISFFNGVIAFFVLKFAIFRCHGNRGRSEQFLTIIVKQADPQTPYLVKASGLYLFSLASYGHFYVEICIFRYHGNRGRSEQFLTIIVKQADPQNPLLGEGIWVISF